MDYLLECLRSHPLSNDQKVGNHRVEIKTSGDFENDPQGAMDALAQSGFMVFVISDKWYDSERSQKEWRFAKDMDKPMVYLIRESGRTRFRTDMFTPNLIGTINDYGDMKKTRTYLQAFITAYEKNLEE